MSSLSLSPSYWITCTSLGLFTFIVNTVICNIEWRRRKSNKAEFATKHLKIFSAICIFLGSIVGFILCVVFINGFCYVTDWIFNIAIYYQVIFMGFYQLSRLYYCFAQTKVYSNRGYPNWVFLIMFGIGIILMILILPLTFKMITDCGIDYNWVFHYHKSKPIMFDSDSVFISLIFILISWDLLTLALYASKIWMLNRTSLAASSNDKIKARIVSILYKIAIITLFYELVLVIIVLLNLELFGYCPGLSEFAWSLSHSAPTASLTFAMFIMMEHNKATYYKFLRVLSVTRLYWIGCCCCRHMVKQQIAEIDKSLQRELSADIDDVRPEAKRNRGITKETIYDEQMRAHDIEPNHAAIEFKKTRSELESIDDKTNGITQ